MGLELRVGPEVISSYKRLAYSPWHALAEFIDNSTQAYFDHRETLDREFARAGEMLEVAIAYDKDRGYLRIADNSIGMSFEDLERALHVARPPVNAAGRSRYGMGLKTAACWLGNQWTVTTKKLGETLEHRATVIVEQIAAGNGALEYAAVKDRPADLHYTIVEIEQLNRTFHGRTLGKIREFLRSMYREDFRRKQLRLSWNGVELEWEDLDDRLLKAMDGSTYKREFNFEVEGSPVRGWVGIFDKGGRADAGFTIIHCGRVIRGWPDSWRPSSLYGQMLGTNDLINQRLVGEIHLDQFEVSHTKDDILWLGNQEEEVERKLLEHCADYRDRARDRRKSDDDERGPSEKETDVAVDELKKELSSPEMVDAIEIEAVPAPDVVDNQARVIAESIEGFDATFVAKIRDVEIKGFLRSDMSPNDPYVTHDSTQASEVVIIVNQAHPHWKQLKGSDGVLNYLRHCVYDGIAEWQAKHKAAALNPNTIKLLKDRLLRVPFEIDMNAQQGA